MNSFNSTCRQLTRKPRRLISRILRGNQSTPAKRNEWFLDYHSDPSKQLVGLREKTDERLRLFRTEDIQGKRVLDAGCNMGGISNHCVSMGARSVTGIDFDNAAVRRARDLYSATNASFRCDDLDNPLAMLQTFDTVMFLSVFGTKELEDRHAILSRLASLGDVMYFEGHHGDDPRSHAWALFKYGGFQSIEFLGYTNDELRDDSQGRPFFRCDRRPRSVTFLEDYLAQRAASERASKVAIVGRSGTGKTHLANQWSGDSRFKGLTILDDVADAGIHNAAERLALLDYRAGTYLDNVDALFFLDIDENTRLQRLQGDAEREDEYNALLRTPPVKPNFLSFYRVEVSDDQPTG